MNPNKQSKKHSKIFVKNDKLTDEAINACKILHIDPSMLIPKTKDSFKDSLASPTISDIRYFHFEEKRKALIDEVEEYIKGSGQRGIAKLFLRSEIQRAKMINPGSPFLTTTKPDIPLRQPLEEENKSKRKAAKEIFEKEKWEKVIQNKIKMQHDHDEKLEKFKKKEIDKLKSAEKIIKEKASKEISKLNKWNVKLERANEKAEQSRKEQEREQQKKFIENEKKRSATLQKRKIERRKRDKLMYESDQKHYFEIKNLSMTRKKEDDDEVKRKLEDFDRKMKYHTDNKNKCLLQVSQRAEDHIKTVMSRLDVTKNKDPEEDKDYTELAEKFKKKIKCIKKRDEDIKRTK